MDIELKMVIVNEKVDILGDVTRKQLEQTELLQDAIIRLEKSMLDIVEIMRGGIELYGEIKPDPVKPEVSRRTIKKEK